MHIENFSIQVVQPKVFLLFVIFFTENENSICSSDYLFTKFQVHVILMFFLTIFNAIINRGFYYFFHFVTSWLFFDDWRNSFEIIEKLVTTLRMALRAVLC